MATGHIVEVQAGDCFRPQAATGQQRQNGLVACATGGPVSIALEPPADVGVAQVLGARPRPTTDAPSGSPCPGRPGV
jgi:hypothetical protein